MNKINCSPLAVIRQIKSHNASCILELSDPINNIDIAIHDGDLADLNKIKNLVSSVTVESSPFDELSNWINKGWNKSLDFYVATKANTKENFSKAKVNGTYSFKKKTNETYTIPQALLKRRTKRVFINNNLNNDTFNSALNIGLERIYKSIVGYKIYFVVYAIKNIRPGVYLYNFNSASLQTIEEGKFSEQMAENIQGLRSPKTAAFTIIIVGEFDKLMSIYPDKDGLRQVYIECGRMAQKLIISYEQYGLSCLVTPALKDRPVMQLLKLSEPEFCPLYSLTFGIPIK
jgi:SagB-type dehydrogenase family enzyme